MKITAEHYAHMKAAIDPLAETIAERRAAIIAEGKAQDVEKRLRWDLSYASGLTPWICDNLYTYCTDDHVDTALRSIVRDAELSLDEHLELEDGYALPAP